MSAKSNRREKDSRMATMLAPAPNHHNGVGRDAVVLANKLGTLWKGRESSTFTRGMIGGMCAEAQGYALPLDLK